MTFRIGHGYDIHRLRSGGELRLGGVVVSQEMSAVAHSDGDVVIHAVVDALLGAAGLGDIGEHFPDSDAKWRGAESSVFLREVHRMLTSGGWAVVNVDVTVMAERPRLKDFKGAMVQHLASILGCDVNIKAGTNEGCDAVGRGEAIAAHAVALIRRGN
jgi:2-C-methyl-D-erythritol 2,4-cyclodiphosphate synthase